MVFPVEEMIDRISAAEAEYLLLRLQHAKGCADMQRAMGKHYGACRELLV